MLIYMKTIQENLEAAKSFIRRKFKKQSSIKMIPGLDLNAKKAEKVSHFNYPEETATVDTLNWKFSYSTNDLKIVQFTNIPQFTEEEDDLIIKFGMERRPVVTEDWVPLGKAIGKSAIACRFRYYGPLQKK
eukprot:NODE_406_length_7988_cov_0.615794.p5 type:complete len:131 gc:universal NODE_406_length_7988_cov_0.615794:2717-2325(-)